MASSTNSATTSNAKFKIVKCDCGRKASVEVSNSAKNPGRLYYGCAMHGWLKWVMTHAPMDDEVKLEDARRRTTTFPEVFVPTMNPPASRDTIDYGNGIGVGTLKTLVAINLVLLAAFLFAQLIKLLKD